MSHENRDWTRAFAPATVANVACGFDVFGFALDEPGDVVAARRRETPGLILTGITGDDARLPREVDRNTAGVAARCLMNEFFASSQIPGVELCIEKGLPLASGLGSSAASAVAAVVAVNALLDLDASSELLLRCAVEGERIATGGVAHADNAAPALHGGFTIVRDGLQVTPLPVPEGLTCALVHPYVEVRTGEARQLIGDRIGLVQASTQWGNAAALVAGLFRGDFELIASALHDAVAEPVRSLQVPGYPVAKQAAMRAGALGSGLSGSGPSIFAFCESRALAEVCAAEMAAAFHSSAGLHCDVFVSPVGAPGARLLAVREPACVS